MLWRVLQSNGGLPDDAVVCFANTGKEDPATLEFVDECSQQWGIQIKWLEYSHDASGYKEVNLQTASRFGEPFELLIKDKKALPNGFMRFCTYELKINIVHKYLRDIGLATPDLPCDQMVGIRVDEPRRVAKMRAGGGEKSGKNWIGDFLTPLADAGVGVGEIGNFWKKSDFDLNLPSINGRTYHGNCDLCFHKPVAQLVSLISEKPSRAVWWIDMEKHAEQNFAPAFRVFSRDHPKYSSMAEFSKEQRDLFDQQEEAIPCFCGD